MATDCTQEPKRELLRDRIFKKGEMTMLEILERLTEDSYLKGPFVGPNHAKRRSMSARKPKLWHRRGHTPTPPKKHIAKPHEARHLHCINR